MGKGYNNYMCKKPFHPGSKANIKRAWMAEQKTESEKKKQEELKVQYEKEQDLYNNRALISSESKDKLELNFMYEAPPGAKRERQKEDDEPEYKFEWQRKYNAPREDYAKGNADIKDQPFGIPVRNVRCIKCHKWGHINTDKECPLYSQASSSSMPTTSMDPMELMRQMREDGYGLKENVLGHHLNPRAANQQLIPSDESDPETEFLKSLSTAEKKKLLRKLKKLSKKQAKNSHSKKKKSKKSHKSKGKESSSSDSENKKRKRKKKKHKESSSSSSDTSSDESTEKNVKKLKESSAPSFKKRKRCDSEDSANQMAKKRSKHQTRDTSEEEIGSKSHPSKKSRKSEHFKSNQENEKESVNDREKHRNRHDLIVPSKKEPKELEKNDVIKSSWKSSYSSSSSENEELGKQPKTEKKSTKYKANYKPDDDDETTKKIKIEKSDFEKDSHRPISKSINCDDKPDHPDGFSHVCPQAKIESNYLPSEEEYRGKIHDRFRHLNRDKRSPSVKQKYNK